MDSKPAKNAVSVQQQEKKVKLQEDLLLKQIKVSFQAKEQSEGVGARVKRYIGNKYISDLDPFLMLDEFCVKLPAGFPDHPHRGMETVTYMLSGEMLHEDSRGNAGTLGPGDMQWMTAGKGIVHAEIPASFEVPAHGFQLWINLERSRKYCQPQYQEIAADQVKTYNDGNIKAKILAGNVFGHQSAIYTRTPAFYAMFELNKGRTYTHEIPKKWNSIVICTEGQLMVQDDQQVYGPSCCCQFKINKTQNERIKIESLQDGTKFLMLAGQPLNEPIAHYGPFVLNEKRELQKAIDDFRQGRNGFEGAPAWNSKIKELRYRSKTV